MEPSENLTHEETSMIMKFLHKAEIMASKRVRHYHDCIFDADDLFQEGIIGLIEAARCFDPAKGANFNTYAEHRIRWAILTAWRDMDVIARRRAMSDEQIATLDAWFHRHMKEATDTHYTHSGDEDALTSILFGEVTHLVIQLFPRRTQQLFTWYYADGLTMKEIGFKLSITESMVSKIHTEAIKLLRKHLIAFS